MRTQSTIPASDSPDLHGDVDCLLAAAEGYRHDFGWHTELAAGQLMLSLVEGVAAIAVSANRAGDLNSRLILHRLAYPVLPLDDNRHRWVFLARRGSLDQYAEPPHFATVLNDQRRLPLPPSRVNGKVLRWIVDPHSCVDDLPPLAPLLGMLRPPHTTW